MDRCPICNTPLINGTSTANVFEYSQEDLNRICAGIAPDELQSINARTPQYYFRTKLCPKKGNGDTLTNKDGSMPMNPPCPNYHGGDLNNPKKVVETIKIYDN
jgi:hypothetical protein